MWPGLATHYIITSAPHSSSLYHHENAHLHPQKSHIIMLKLVKLWELNYHAEY